jgi:hypothetical protein
MSDSMFSQTACRICGTIGAHLCHTAGAIQIIPDETYRLRRLTENQARALDHWRKSYDEAAAKIHALEAEVAEHDALMELQHSRTVGADKLWRAAHPERGDVMPDLGELIEWLCGCTAKATAALSQERYRRCELCGETSYNAVYHRDPVIYAGQLVHLAKSGNGCYPCTAPSLWLAMEGLKPW